MLLILLLTINTGRKRLINGMHMVLGLRSLISFTGIRTEIGERLISAKTIDCIFRLYYIISLINRSQSAT